MTNTKLTLAEREIRQDLKLAHENVELFSFPELNCVVGIERTGETMGRFAVSICAFTEQKFRRKTGEYHVLCRFDDGYTLPVYIGGECTQYLAENIATILGRGT